MIKIDLHIHSCFSKDSFSKPESIVLNALRNDISALALTDHETTAGWSNLREATQKARMIFIPGEEINTEYGDIIGLFLKSRVPGGKFEKVEQAIREQGGVVVLPHPFSRKSRFPEHLIPDHIDMVEVFNSRQKSENNCSAIALARKYNKPFSAGSDSHTPWRVGKGFLEIEGDRSVSDSDLKKKLLEGNANVGGTVSYFSAHAESLLIEKIKSKFRFSNI